MHALMHNQWDLNLGSITFQRIYYATQTKHPYVHGDLNHLKSVSRKIIYFCDVSHVI